MVELLGDVPLPSLYRHLHKLVKGGILTVADERRVRGIEQADSGPPSSDVLDYYHARTE